MSTLEDVINELVTTTNLASTTGRLSSRKRRAKAPALSNSDKPVATLFENASAIPSPAPIGTARSQRQTKRAAKPDFALSAAPPSGPAGADEAKADTASNVASPHRQKSRAVQSAIDIQASVDSAAGRANSPATPKSSLPDPILPDNAGRYKGGTLLPPARVRRSDHGEPESQPNGVAAAPNSDDHCQNATQTRVVIGGDDGAHSTNATRVANSPVVAEIIQLWRMRQRWHRAEKSLILQGKAVCRAWTAGDKEAASGLFDRAAKGEDVDPFLAMALTPFLKAIENFAPERAAIEKRLRKLAKSLPVYPWVASARGFGELNLAAIVGEAGEIGTYRGPACLWKRMGLAVIDGGRQRRIADAEQALIHGYNPNRRCVAYLLGETLIKANGEGEFKVLYDERKAYELARTDDNKPKSQAHAHNRAARVMTKRALQRLWVEWRAVDRGYATSVTHTQSAPVGTFLEAAE